jgi:hypothetical protein
MRKSKKHKTIKKRYKKCVYTDEAKRIIKYTKILRQKNNKIMKTMKNIKTK